MARRVAHASLTWPDYSYRKPIETVNAVIDILRVQWSVLDDSDARDELTSILTSYRAALYQAAGDYARGTVMINLTYALEAADSAAGRRTDAAQGRSPQQSE